MSPTKLEIIPDRTSPDPIVASSGVEFVLMHISPFGDAIIVLYPLRTITALERFEASDAAVILFFKEILGKIFLNSPSCGVIFYFYLIIKIVFFVCF